MEKSKTIREQLEDMPNTGACDLLWILKNVGKLRNDRAREIIAHLSERAREYGMKLIDGYFHFGSGPMMKASDHHALEQFLLEEARLVEKWLK